MIDDMFTQLRDDNGNLTGLTRPVTPAEISAAHPKCGSCGYREHVKAKVNSLDQLIPAYDHCMNEKTGWTLSEWGEPKPLIIDPTADYCRWHSELTKGKEDDN